MLKLTELLLGAIPCFAPSKEAAELEGSKAYAKDFMQRHNIPTAKYQNFDDFDQAKRYVHSLPGPMVIKASGLAAGKGVVLPKSETEAIEALEDIMLRGKFGTAGASVVIEEYLEGNEISILTLSDGISTWSFPAGQDHKRIYDGDQGPNTGGMGVYAPTPFVSTDLMTDIEANILKPTFAGLEAEGNVLMLLQDGQAADTLTGRIFRGCLFTGIMITPKGSKVLEYNTRFGDPETESMIPLLTNDTDLAQVLLACTSGTLSKVHVGISSKFACNVIVAAGGYPDTYHKGDEITFGQCPEGKYALVNEYHGHDLMLVLHRMSYLPCRYQISGW
jgi:phosphoribosylamine--glycine ligase/phosphoribosylformylglycinamidine cyclo-ligase